MRKRALTMMLLAILLLGGCSSAGIRLPGNSCDMCRGTGECYYCEGSTWCTYCLPNRRDPTRTCSYCDGDGECPRCNSQRMTRVNGSLVPCFYCGQENKCSNCKGTGYGPCRFCDLNGRCKMCGRSGVCTTCGGNGKK